MARKTPEKPKMSTAAESTKTKPVRLDLDPTTHRLLRLVAADHEMSMASYAREVLGRHLADEAKRRGIKS